MTSTRLKSEEIYRERVPSDSLFASKTRSGNSAEQQQQQQHQRQEQQQQQQTSQQQSAQVEDVSEDPEDVFGPPPLPKASDSFKTKSKVASLFDDSDSGDDLFATASPSARSQKSSEPTPSRTSNQRVPSQAKAKSLFDDEDDLFGAKDAPDVDLFGAVPVRSLSKVTDGLFDDVPPLDVDDDEDDLFGDSKAKGRAAGSLFGEAASKDSLFAASKKIGTAAEGLFAETLKKSDASSSSSIEPVRNEPVETKVATKQPIATAPREAPKTERASEERKKKSSRGLFGDSEDSDDSDLFSKASKPPSAAATAAPDKSACLPVSSKGLFEDTEDSDLFGTSGKNVPEKSSSSLFGEPSKPTSLFASKTEKVSEDKAVEKASPEDIFDSGKSKLARSKKLTTSIFDDNEDDEDDLFGGSKRKSSSSLFKEDESAKNMDEERKTELEKASDKKEEEKPPVATKPVATKVAEKKSIFSADDDEEDDDDDLFGDKKKKTVKKSSPPAVGETKTEAKEKANSEAESKTETSPSKPDVAPKNALFAEMRQKLEKQHRNEKQADKNGKSESSVVDGAVISKKEPPKSLKIQTGLPIPSSDESSTSQSVTKKPAVSAKIKNLLGNMEGLKILSPTDTPPLFRKNNKEENNGNDDEQDTPGDLGSSEASTPSLASGASSPHTSGSRARDSPSLKSDNTEGAISFDEPVQVETLTSIASKSRARIPAKRRPQSRQARHSALLQSGIDFDVPDVISNSPTNDQPNGDANGDVQIPVDRLHPSRNQVDGVHGGDDKSEISASRNTTTNLLSPSTDEEDLFDVPPDLPEDPAAKEDSLFGRAPILSPIERIERPKEKLSREENDVVDDVKGSSKEEKKEEKAKTPIDPLRDDNHDPLKDPSQLFAFVTKTPSPEKNKGLILNEDDDSLFSSSSKTNTKAAETKTKPSLGLFDDEDDDASGSDLFSNSKAKIEKKPLKDTKIDLFDEAALEDNEDESLFGSSKKHSEITDVREQPPPLDEKPEPKSIKNAAKDIFGDSSDEDDIFASSKKTIPKKKSTSLFDDEDDGDDDDIFGSSKPSSLQDSKAKVDSTRPVVKKAVTRDLKKTAEKIVEDPLSMLQDD